MTTTPTLWSAAVQINETDLGANNNNSQSASKLVAIGGGRFVVVWEDDTSELTGFEPNDIAGRIVGPTGVPEDDDFVASWTYFDFDQSQADVMALPGGGFAVAYKSADAAGLGDGENITVDIFDSAGNPVSSDDFRQFTGDPVTLDDTRPSLTALSGGSYAVVYEQTGGTNGNIVGHIVTNGVIGAEFAIEQGANDSLAPDTATLSNGNWIVAYQLQNAANTTTEIRYSVRDTSGANILDTSVSSGADLSNQAPSVVGLSNGGFVIVWEKDNSIAPGVDGFKVAVYAASGSAPTILSSNDFAGTAGPHVEPSITALPDGGFVIVWRDDLSKTIRGHRFDVSGAEVGAEFTAASVDDLSAPEVSLLGDGRIAISMTNTDGTGDKDVYVTIWDPRTGPITGTAGDDVLTNRIEGGVIWGGAGNDVMIGAAGNDIFRVAEAGDVIREAIGNGTSDRVIATVSYVLTAGAEVELLTTNSSTATAAINLTGNALAQEIVGNAGANTLRDGAGAADHLSGLLGNDIYQVYSAGTLVFESAGGGTADRVMAAVDYKLGAGVYVELLTTNGATGTSGIDLTGNALAQSITGNAGANILNDGGKGGADTMTGLGGNDTYRVYNSDDVIVEGASQGTADQVIAGVDYSLGAGVHVEKMATNGSTGTSAIDLAGNEFAQSIFGNAGSNILDGKGGNDVLQGGAGQDFFVFSTAVGAGNVDTLSDFSPADDTIRLENAIFTALTPTGVLLSGYFRANTTGTAQDANDHIIYETDTGKLFYDADGNGAGASIQFAALGVNLALTNADFVIL